MPSACSHLWVIAYCLNFIHVREELRPFSHSGPMSLLMVMVADSPPLFFASLGHKVAHLFLLEYSDAVWGSSGKEGLFSKLFSISPSRIYEGCIFILEEMIGRASLEHCKLFSNPKLGSTQCEVKWITGGRK